MVVALQEFTFVRYTHFGDSSVVGYSWGVEEEGKKEEANGREFSDSIMTVNRSDTLLGGEAARLAEVETEQKSAWLQVRLEQWFSCVEGCIARTIVR
jgi:hypothetical protein